jgi:hypothetical protein
MREKPSPSVKKDTCGDRPRQELLRVAWEVMERPEDATHERLLEIVAGMYAALRARTCGTCVVCGPERSDVIERLKHRVNTHRRYAPGSPATGDELLLLDAIAALRATAAGEWR